MSVLSIYQNFRMFSGVIGLTFDVIVFDVGSFIDIL